MKTNKSNSLCKPFPALGWGTHICNIYRNDEERISVVAPYLQFGLLHNQRCIHISEEIEKKDICRTLRELGIDVDSCIRSGQLILLTEEETYLKEGFFSPLTSLNSLQDAHYDTLKSGYSGLRCCGEVSLTPKNDRLIDYERDVNYLFLHNHLIALCQYHEEKIPENILVDVIHTHPKIAIHGKFYNNPFYISPNILRERRPQEYKPGYYFTLRDYIQKAM